MARDAYSYFDSVSLQVVAVDHDFGIRDEILDPDIKNQESQLGPACSQRRVLELCLPVELYRR